MTTLDQIAIENTVKVVSFKNLLIASRLMSMGITPGVSVVILRKTLAGSTYLLQFPQLTLALRKDEVEQIVVESSSL